MTIRQITTLADAGRCGLSAVCRQAVVRTYSEMLDLGVSDPVAFQAAERVYAWHHPDVPRRLVPFVVAEWLP
ncbi:MAG: hypothetical protein RLO01_20520 [Thalassobaculaceae bacterium]